MKPKTLVILLVILALLAGAGALLIHSRDVRPPSEAMGAFLFDKLPANDIAAIVIQTPKDVASLKRGPDFWIVEERFGYRADFSKISELVRTLRELKMGRKFEASEKVVNRLALRSPDDPDAQQVEKGTRIRMADAQAAPLVDMVLGNTRNRDPEKGPPDGQYAMLGDRSEIYLIDRILSPYQTGPAQWLEKSPVQVDAAEIRRIASLESDGSVMRYAVERSVRGKDLEWVGPPPVRNINKSSVNRLSSALSSLRIDDVEPASADSKFTQKDAYARLDYTLFDGRVYHVYTGKSCSAGVLCRIRLEVSYESPQAQAPGADQTGQADEKRPAGGEKEQVSQGAAKASEENNRVGPWVFTIPEWQHQAFVTDGEALLETKNEQKDAVGAPAK